MKNSPRESHTPRCQICGKDLTNPISINLGIGPECMVKKATFLAAAGTTIVEIEMFATSGSNVARWIPRIMGAINAGRHGDVERFVLAAREAGRSA